MASPPFSINQALPGDSDIVSQHPGNARTFRDVVESWLLINHDTNGNHARVDIPRSATPTTPAASIDVLYTTTTGRLKIKHPDGTEEYVGLPPGGEIYVSGALPTGYLEKDGSAISRTTFADLFAYLGTTFGAGDGSTTFNLPDDKGRVLAGIDSASTRLSSTYFGAVPTINAVGGSQSHTLSAAQIPSITSTVTGTVSETNIPIGMDGAAIIQINAGNAYGPYWSASPGAGEGIESVLDVTGTSTSNNTGGTAHNNVQPTRIARAVIKY